MKIISTHSYRKFLLLLVTLNFSVFCYAKDTLQSSKSNFSPTSTSAATTSLYELKVKDIDGKLIDLSKYKNKVLLIVNSASQCGYTPQFKDLEKLQSQYGSKGFQVLAFPSNDFKQDLGSNLDSKKLAQSEYKVSFPLFDKQSVTGDSKQPVFKFLTDQSNSIPKEIQWNFEKFLVNKKGQVVERFRSGTNPTDATVTQAIEKLIKE